MTREVWMAEYKAMRFELLSQDTSPAATVLTVRMHLDDSVWVVTYPQPAGDITIEPAGRVQ